MITREELSSSLREHLDSNKTRIEEAESRLDNVDSQLATKASKLEVDVERKRIDSFTKLAEGSTTGDAELIDGRIGIDGIIYSNIGDSIRNQINNVNNDIECIVGEKIIYDYEFIQGGYIDNETGELITYEGWKYTDFIIIGENTKHLIVETTLEGSYSYNAFYTEDKVFISNFNVNQNKIIIPDNAYYFRLSSTNEATIIINKGIETLNEKCNSEDVTEISSSLNEKLIDCYMGIKAEYSYNWINGGYIDNLTGDFIEYDNWLYTDFIELTHKYNELEVTTTLGGSYSYNAFYDENKEFISSFAVSVNSVTIPNNAKYVRLSVSKGSTTIIKNKIDKLIDKCSLEDVRKIIGDVKSTDVVSLNKDVESFLIQASEGLGVNFTDKTKPLVFAHFSDIHTKQELWNRIIEYVNNYSDYINFAIHTGDYCGGSQLSYVDLYANGIPCVKPIFNCVGNHDTFLDNQGTKGSKQKTKELLFNHIENWNVVFMDIANSMTYYKDYPNQKIRFIVLDYYFDIDEQCTWLLERLNGAKALGYHVVTCMHEMTNIITTKLNCTFQTIDNFESLGGNKYSISKFDKVIGDWIKTGGVHVANFAGHEHSDFIGYTENGVLNVCVQAATDNIIWTDGKRIKDTRTWDCFNVVSVEVSTGTLKLIRIGNNSDHYLREKKILSYDYINKKILFN